MKLLTDEPSNTTAWAQGAVGEERLAHVLDERLGDAAIGLHDRKVPRTKGNIDHLYIAASGVWIVDAKNYRGVVERRDVGGWFSTDLRLYVAGRDRTAAVRGMGWQREAVERVLEGWDVPVRCVVCFTDAEWKLLSKPFEMSGVLVTHPRGLRERLEGGGPLDAERIVDVARRLAEHFPAK